jgi:phage/plasmid-like protein (TIGR03299 family)
MPHELEFVDNTASMFSVRATPWHREGVLLTAAPTFAEALELGRLDYEVVKARTQFECHTPDGDTYYKPSTRAWVTVRTDRMQELGAVGSDYVPVQNRDAFRVLEPLVDEGVATLETGGVLRDGADAWLLVKWDLTRFGPKAQASFGQELLPYSTIANNHNGRRGILLQDTSVRVVCANTLAATEQETRGSRVVVRHDAQGLTKLVEAAHTLWGGIIARHEVLADQYDALRRTYLTQEQFERAVVQPVAPDPRLSPRFNPDARLAEMVVQRWERKRDAIQRLWREGTGHTGEPTAWYAWQGLIEAIDHQPELFPTRGGTYRTASLLDGALREHKLRTFQNLLALAV